MGKNDITWHCSQIKIKKQNPNMNNLEKRRERMAPPGNRRGTGRLLGKDGIVGSHRLQKRKRLQRSLEIGLLENALVKSFLPRCDQTIKLIFGFPKS